MDPGTLVADIGHLKEVGIEARVAHGFLEKRFVGAGRTGRHHHPVEALFLDNLGHFILGVLGAAEKVFFHVCHIGQAFGVFSDGGHISHAADVDAAVAHKYADFGILAFHRHFAGELAFLDKGPPGGRELYPGAAGSGTGLHHRFGDVFGTLEGAADIDALPGGLDRGGCVGFAKVAVGQLDVQPLGQVDDIR